MCLNRAQLAAYVDQVGRSQRPTGLKPYATPIEGWAEPYLSRSRLVSGPNNDLSPLKSEVSQFPQCVNFFSVRAMANGDCCTMPSRRNPSEMWPSAVAPSAAVNSPRSTEGRISPHI